MAGALSDEAARFIAELTGEPPRRPELWYEALTHGSLAEGVDYDRLEFLGDRVLGMAIGEWLFERGKLHEGSLSQRLNALVSGQTCAAIAREIGLPPHIRMDKQARDDGGHDSDNILGDVIESLLGALYVERGWDAARQLVRKLWDRHLAAGKGERKHPKGALQEWAAGNKRKPPVYTVVDRRGPDHALTFTVEVSVPGVGEARATAGSKQQAETAAAEAFMQAFG